MIKIKILVNCTFAKTNKKLANFRVGNNVI